MSALKKAPNLVSVTTINADGSRHFLHPADVAGFWTRLRVVFGWLLIAIYIALPWIPINGHPAVFLDLEKLEFHLFGFTLFPQELWLMFFAITGTGFTLFFLTSLFGRLWCGWSCPYTVFIDHIYRRIERWIDGDPAARRKLDEAPWTLVKASKRVLKHGLYALISAAIAHVFLSYFVSLKRLYGFMQEGPLAHATAFGVVLSLTLVLWFCFGYFREQFCIIMCPYGRLQSALTDDDTVIIGYDEKRGEPRGPLGKTDGACVDCRRCIQVCPTGIDIRNGLQLECLGCTACIDACDDIMTKVGKPKGLIRYDSFNGFAGLKRRIIRPRIIAYCVLALLGMAAFGVVASLRLRPISASITRASGSGFACDAEAVRNIYLIRINNMRDHPVTVTLSLTGDTPAGYRIDGSDHTFTLGPHAELTRSCVVIAPMAVYRGASDITLGFHGEPGGVKVEKTAHFLGPNPNATHPAP